MKKIGFVSTRIAGGDGVTLETYKWYKVLARNGYECYFFAGELDTPRAKSFWSRRPILRPRKSWISNQHLLE